MTYDQPIIRTLHPETRIIDAGKGILDYIASDETLDSYREVVRVDGWRFNRFQKNAPFVDSHDYYCIDKLLGKVLSWRIENSPAGKPQLIQRVQWAIDVEENTLAQLGWKMTVGKYLKAVSVGFMPIQWVTPWGDATAFANEFARLEFEEGTQVNTIFLEQEQLELSACIIGANPSAVARAYKGGAIGDQDVEQLDTLVRTLTPAPNEFRIPPQSASTARQADAAAEAKSQQREEFITELYRMINE